MWSRVGGRGHFDVNVEGEGWKAWRARQHTKKLCEANLTLKSFPKSGRLDIQIIGMLGPFVIDDPRNTKKHHQSTDECH